MNVKNNCMNNNTKEGVGRCFASFGELLQGVLPNGRKFLVTCPIQLYSYAYFSPTTCPLKINPKEKVKSLSVIKKFLNYNKLPNTGLIKINSHVPEGKGLASSTADLIACIRAVSDYYQLDCSEKNIEYFLAETEPSDGIIYNCCVSYYHQDVQLRRQLAPCSKLAIIAIDEGGSVNTIDQHNSLCNIAFNSTERTEYSFLLNQLEQAILNHDYNLIGKISTRSAILNQKVLKNKYLDAMIQVNKKHNGLGIIIAHSGTYIGILTNNNNVRDNIMLDIEKYINIKPVCYDTL